MALLLSLYFSSTELLCRNESRLQYVDLSCSFTPVLTLHSLQTHFSWVRSLFFIKVGLKKTATWLVTANDKCYSAD